MKKSGLGKDPLSWIKTTVPETSKRKRGRTLEISKNAVPKFQTFEVRLTVPFSEEHLTFLDHLQREILKNRDHQHKKERITKNSIIRACVDAFRNTRLDLKNIPDEETLLERLKDKIKS